MTLEVNKFAHYTAHMSESILNHLGATVRSLRRARGLSQSRLAEESGLSRRYMAQLEAGTANVSVLRLAQVADVLGVHSWELLAGRDQQMQLALLGLRGAGKSTVGRSLAEALGVEFVELDEEIEEAAGMGLGQVFELHGEAFYRRLEQDVLKSVLQRRVPLVLATGGGLVTNPRAFETLLSEAWTIWLKAEPKTHWDRVIEQGDRRPMTGRPDAFAELERLWKTRAPFYSQAHLTLDTENRGVSELVNVIQSHRSNA